MDKIAYYEQIAGRKVGVILIFDEYRQPAYRKEFGELKKYQQKLSLTGEKGETYFKFYNIKEMDVIPYDFFRKKSAEYFSRIIFDIIMLNPGIYIMSDELNIQVHLIKDQYGSFTYLTDDSGESVSDTENACFEGGGKWFIESIVMPLYYLRKVDYGYISRFMSHELTHYVAHMNKVYEYEDTREGRVGAFARNKKAYGINYIDTACRNLCFEGFPDFKSRSNSSYLELDMASIAEFNKNMLALAHMLTKKEALPFYEKKIGFDNLTASGEYTNGRYMCTTIMMYLAKINKIPYRIKAGSQTYEGYDFPRLARWLSGNRVIYILDYNIPKSYFDKSSKRSKVLPSLLGITSEKLAPLKDNQFIALYEEAARSLGIPDKEMVMTRRRYRDLIREAVDYSRKLSRKRQSLRRKKGFI